MRQTHLKESIDLKKLLRKIDRKGYKTYKEIKGSYDFDEYVLIIDHVQGDPFASPSKIRVKVPQKVAGFPSDTFQKRSREIALRDFLTRRFFGAAKKFSKGGRGTGKSGLITVDRPGQEMLERTACFVTDQFVEVRLFMGLPAFGRTISGNDAHAMFFDELPKIVRSSLIYKSLDSRNIYEHIETAEDADYLREQLDPLGLIAFVADGSLLPRASGIDQRPLTKGTIVSFESPDSLRRELELPNRGKITGMGIPSGVTLIVGGGYHGKSTLLNALELGIYNHIPADGREMVVAKQKAVKIRAEDGRRIEKVDISPFISNLPFGQDTVEFSTDDASGSTSQAANIIEALEIGTDTILLDEDTSATNFMIRDHRMQQLVSKDKEPITPFIDKVKQLYRDHGVSTVLVIGGSGEYFDVADHVICMIDYKPKLLTSEARGIALKYKAERNPEGGSYFGKVTERIPFRSSFDPSRGKREAKITPKGLLSISFGVHEIDLGSLEQLIDMSQTRAVGDALYYATKYMDGSRTIKEAIDQVMKDIEADGLDVLSRSPAGDYAAFRNFELAGAMNRLRTLSVQQKKS